MNNIRYVRFYLILYRLLCKTTIYSTFNVWLYLSGEDPRFNKRGIGQYPARLSGGFQSPTEINASGGSQPRKKEGASHHARRGKNAEAFLNHHRAMLNAPGTPKHSWLNHEHRGVHCRVNDYDLTYFVFNYRISNIKT